MQRGWKPTRNWCAFRKENQALALKRQPPAGGSDEGENRKRPDAEHKASDIVSSGRSKPVDTRTQDDIPLENEFDLHCPGPSGQCTASLYAFNTVVTLQAYGDAQACRMAFEQAREACRRYERLFSRTLPHSDISRINAAAGSWVDVSRETYELLAVSKHYCAESEGAFDITIGSIVRLWNFHQGVVADPKRIEQALPHVDWRCVELETAPRKPGELDETDDVRETYRARLADEHASVDVGGTAKGWIADKLGTLLLDAGIDSFIVNLGGNVLAHGAKPDGNPWMIGLQDPRASRESGRILGAVPLANASAVTSGTYERAFESDGVAYHHILDPKTGMPVKTDIAGATVIAQTSLDAEGYSTTLLALGRERAARFVESHPAIMAAYLADNEGRVTVLARP